MSQSLKKKILNFERMHNSYEGVSAQLSLLDSTQETSTKNQSVSPQTIYYKLKKRKDLVGICKHLLEENAEKSKQSLLLGFIGEKNLNSIALALSSCIEVLFQKRVLIISSLDLDSVSSDLKADQELYKVSEDGTNNVSILHYSNYLSAINYSLLLNHFTGRGDLLVRFLNNYQANFDKVLFVVDHSELNELPLEIKAPIINSSHYDLIIRRDHTTLPNVRKSAELLSDLGLNVGGVIYENDVEEN